MAVPSIGGPYGPLLMNKDVAQLAESHRVELETKLGRLDMFTPILVRTQDVSVGTNFLIKIQTSETKCCHAMICVGSDKNDSCLNFFQGDLDLYEPLRPVYITVQMA